MKPEVTTRFLQAMSDIIFRHRRAGGACINVRAFAKSIDTRSDNFPAYKDPDNGRNVTLEMCIMIGKVHGVDMNWLLLDKGEMYGKDGAHPIKKVKSPQKRTKKNEHA